MFTKNIKLSARWKKTYSLALSAMIFLLIIFVLFLGYRILFPSEFFSYSFGSIEGTNTIINVSKNESALQFDTVAVKRFSKVEINIKTKKNSPSLNGINIDAEKTYISFLYPQGEDIAGPDQYKINQLVSEGDSVYIVSPDKKYPINNPATFEIKGYKWENIVSSISLGLDMNSLDKQKLFTKDSVHPEGTILRDKSNGRYFFIGRDKKYELKGAALQNPQLEKYAIDSEDTKIPDACKLSKSLFSSRKYICDILIDSLEDNIGSDFRFHLNTPNGIDPESIDVTFKRTLDVKNLMLSLSDIKRRILERYGLISE